MLSLVAVELAPQALGAGRQGLAGAGALIGGGLMLAFAATLGV